MAGVDGGRIAARGFQYQYLRTLEYMFDALGNPEVAACRVEGDPNPVNPDEVDAVDFDMVDRSGAVVIAAQVKSRAAGAKMGLAEACTILSKLVARTDARTYLLLTDAIFPSSLKRIFMDAVQSDTSIPQLRETLAGVLRSAPRALAELNALTDVQFERLQRCRIVADGRDREELREAIREQVRRWRRGGGRGIGHHSSGLLVSYLLSETLRRAAAAEHAVWRLDEFRAALELDDKILSDALGARDWGTVLGIMAPIPDVARPELMDQLIQSLRRRNAGARSVMRAALVGPSGIGKSSLAAAYVAECLDLYDVVFWVDASSESSTFESFRNIGLWLGLDPTLGMSSLRALVHERMASFPGRWLLVMDDADATSAEPWIPRFGNGDVIITSLDSVHRFGGSVRVTVTTMLPSEAQALLSARMQPDAPDAATDQAVLSRLAAELEFWPLALELAAAYLESCGFGANDVEHYLTRLKIRSLDDKTSVPPGYPRTLVAAIDLGMARAIDLADGAEMAKLLNDCLIVASYLAQRRIPIHLVAAAARLPPEAVPAKRGIIFGDDPEIPETFRLLKRVSFAREDSPLPPAFNDDPRSRTAITLNSILQEVIRDRVERIHSEKAVSSILDKVAFYVDLWLEAALHNNEPDRVHAVAPHAEVLAAHLRRVGVATNNSAIMLGNLASFHQAQNNFMEAQSLLETELSLFDLIENPNELLLQQTRIYLATILVYRGGRDSEVCLRAVKLLEPVVPYLYAISVDADTQDAASFLCGQAIEALVGGDGCDPHVAAPLLDVLRELSNRLPRHDIVSGREAARRASELIQSGDVEEAESICREHLEHEGPGAGSLYLELRRLLIEALMLQDRWREARAELDELVARMGDVPLYREAVGMTLHNVGFYGAVRMFTPSSKEARQFFLYTMSLPQLKLARIDAPAHETWRYVVLDLAVEVARGRRNEALALTASVKSIVPTAPRNTQDEGWATFARLLCHVAEGKPLAKFMREFEE
ncbi:hypothetical protein [Micromonospora sp. CV4]|uniref:hypothetical protein n=1 Tax=Micromonospora sp. CV4 TaxID=2478711 RepID=UPI0013156699|nr:hypothetical protein [Micromonospora sp. CV4]